MSCENGLMKATANIYFLLWVHLGPDAVRQNRLLAPSVNCRHKHILTIPSPPVRRNGVWICFASVAARRISWLAQYDPEANTAADRVRLVSRSVDGSLE